MEHPLGKLQQSEEFSGIGLMYLSDAILAFGFIETGGLLVNILKRFDL